MSLENLYSRPARFCRSGIAVALLLFFWQARGENPFEAGVRPTDPLAPEEQLKTFHLPPGFEIQLFAAEPELAKPMNMAFDARGRLWLTDSLEYPFAAPLDQGGRDSIKILEDTTGDGRADKITTFADGLNIPIGLHPYKDGVIAWSIPNIWYFADTNGDGKADQREKLYGPLGWERDTHGMNASFVRGFDGWLYATHGFNNNTTLRGRDGSELFLNSGNTYRVRLDGSRVEPHTWGQVNPFGMCLDPLGNFYTADCHSSPIYQLLRGGYYPSFGKPDDGLGFAPALMRHSHGSTAIAGIVYYADDTWPGEYQHNILIGNVMTSRVNRDAIEFRGSSPAARELPDFIRSDDPWFRPVDLQYGPDGALYIADFYNRIIGHYEVPLTHPGRDRERGRIWRVTYRGAGTDGVPADKPAAGRVDISRMSARELAVVLGDSNLTRRMLAMDELTDREGRGAVEPVRTMLRDRPNSFQKIHGMWVLERLGALEASFLRAACSDDAAAVRVHAMRVLGERPDWTGSDRELAMAGLNDPDPNARRAAAEAMGLHPAPEQIGPLLKSRQSVPAADTHLLHVARMALRNQLKGEGFSRLPAGLGADDRKALADVALGIPEAQAGSFLLRHARNTDENRERLAAYLRHAARYAPEEEADFLAEFAREKFGDDLDFQLALFRAVREGAAQRGGASRESLQEWGEGLARGLMASVDEASRSWVNAPIEGGRAGINPWSWERRDSSDGTRGALLLSSLPRGESLTAALRSRPFLIPERFAFYLAGQSGYPGTADPMRNFFRLRAADTDEILEETPVPRNDVAQRYSWELNRHAGRKGYLEAVDGDNGAAYAWIAFGRFDPAVVDLPKLAPSLKQQRLLAAFEIAREYRLHLLQPQLQKFLASRMADAETEAAAIRALGSFDVYGALRQAEGSLARSEEMLRVEMVAQAVAGFAVAEARALLVQAMETAPYRVQTRLAASLAGSKPGAESMLEAIRAGRISPRLLLERGLRDRLEASKPDRLEERISNLTRGLAPLDQKIQKLIEQRRAAFNPGEASAEKGRLVFEQNCAACHQVRGQGGLVGPQLDGIANRGLERLIEDVLDPNRNVDHAFRSHIVVLRDGDVVSGLPRREEGELLVLADSTGREITVKISEIIERRESETSLMPDNYGDILTVGALDDLIAYLLAEGR